MLIIACGNRNRQDDGAGVVAGERLRSYGLRAEILSGEAVELMEAWNGQSEVIVIDAVMTAEPVGTLHVWEGQGVKLGDLHQASSHGLGLGAAIELSRALDCLPRRLRIYGIEARKFGFGFNLSPGVASALERAVTEIIDLVGREHDKDLARTARPAARNTRVERNEASCAS